MQEFVTIPMLGMWKARPVEEAGKRWVYFEGSNENGDQEKERILKKALMESAPFYVANGNIDIDHMTMLGHRLGKDNPHAYEIGVPVEVKEGPYGVFVKGQIYTGGISAGPEFGDASAADWWWHSVNEQDPPQRWFPSVAGPIPEGGKKKICKDGVCREVITQCIWQNTGFAKRPQNLSVASVSTLPFGEFVKAAILAETNACDEGAHCSCTKAVVAGHGTDVAGLTGGQALQFQSIEGRPSHEEDDHAHHYLKAVLHSLSDCEHTMPGAHQSVASIASHFEKCRGLDPMQARRVALRIGNEVRGRIEQKAAA